MCKLEDIRDYIQAHPITEDGKVGTMYATIGLVSGELYVHVYSLSSSRASARGMSFAWPCASSPHPFRISVGNAFALHSECGCIAVAPLSNDSEGCAPDAFA